MVYRTLHNGYAIVTSIPSFSTCDSVDGSWVIRDIPRALGTPTLSRGWPSRQLQRAHMQSLVQLRSSSTCQTLTPKLCTILKRTMASADTRIAYGTASIVLSRGVKPTDRMVAIRLSRLTSSPMGPTKTRLDKNEPRDNRVSLIPRKRKASYTLKSGEGSMTTRGQILTGIH